jgi:hypothetical protein
MKFYIILFIFIVTINSALALSADTTRTELLLLLKQRSDLFNEYTKSLSQRSGLFGNRTKNDLRDSQQKLVEIVTADNKIMNTLKRSLEYRNFEKLNLTYDANTFEEKIRNLTSVNNALNKQNIVYDQDCKNYRSTIKQHRIYFSLLIILLVLSTAAWLRSIFKK